MLDVSKDIVSALKGILPVHHENVLTSKTAIPCISYMELTNFDYMHGTGVEVSAISYQVKVWGKNIEQIQRYVPAVDMVMKALGFTRTSSAELGDSQRSLIQKILTYEAYGFEKFI